MKHLYFSRYQLVMDSGETRDGALLKVQYEEGYGYADLFPWPRYNDPSLEEQLRLAKKKNYTVQIQRSFFFAKEDMELRNKNLRAQTNVLQSHFFVKSLEELDHSGAYPILKLKVGRQPGREIQALNQFSGDSKLRLDFNSVWDQDSFLAFMKQLSKTVVEKIEYIEDPFPYDPLKWEAVNKILPLALDLEIPKGAKELPGCEYVIIKPAIQNPEDLPLRLHKVVASSYLDHPLAQTQVAWWAGKNTQLPGGWWHQHVYSASEFSKKLLFNNGCLQSVEGTGFGFNKLLEGLAWEQVF